MNMIGSALRYGVIFALVAAVLALTGIFTSFANREVIDDRLTLSAVVLGIFLLGAGGMAAASSKSTSRAQTVLAGVIGGLCVGAALACLLVAENAINLSFVFPNLINPISRVLLFGFDLATGIAVLLGLSALLGAAAAGLVMLPVRLQRSITIGAIIAIVVGLLQQQIRNVIPLHDAGALAVTFGIGYAAAWRWGRSPLIKGLIGLSVGTVAAVVIFALAQSGVLPQVSAARSAVASPPVTGQPLPALVIIFGITGIVGGLVTGAARVIHNAATQFVVTLMILGIANQQNTNIMTDGGAILTFLLAAAGAWLIPMGGAHADEAHQALSRSSQRVVTRSILAVGLLVLIAAPPFLGVYITDVLNLVGIYIILGIGLNIVVGYAGLLDLGYVAFFAVGAYTAGLLTTPSLLTCGGIPARQIQASQVAEICTGIMTFWEAWIIAIIVAAVCGILLGIPVLRLRGDYFAIVTLGFGEIIRLLVRFDDFRDLFGSAQGIANIPRPIIDLTAFDPAWRFELTGASGIYYLVLAGILLAAAMSARLARSRLGRSWMALRADEDVAQAMGINLMQIKLTAFAISAAFAGMAGAVQGTRLFGAYPDSYTLLVSINVLSLIIIGGMGSIPGIVVGAFVLVGLPEALRELADYRLLAFGALLVMAMLVKPDGLIPPSIRKWSEIAAERFGWDRKANIQ